MPETNYYVVPISPGELLKDEFLEPMGISNYRLAKEIGVPAGRIGQIIANKRTITADTDLRLCKFFGLSNGYWLRAQATYDLEIAAQKMFNELEEITPWQEQTIAAVDQMIHGNQSLQIPAATSAIATTSIGEGASDAVSNTASNTVSNTASDAASGAASGTAARVRKREGILARAAQRRASRSNDLPNPVDMLAIAREERDTHYDALINELNGSRQ